MPKLGSPISPRARDNKVVLGADPDGAARIRRMLADLWSEVRASDGDRPSFHRVCLANLIVAGPRSDQQNLESFSAGFASAHPSRVIMAIVDPDAGEMTASISASCQRTPSGGDVVCWEKISLNVPSSCDAALTSVIRALLVGRVATVAVLALPSEEWPVLLEGVRRWGDLLVSDLNCATAQGFLYWDRDGYRRASTNWIDGVWERLRPARLSLAQAGDDPETRRVMAEADEIECSGPNPSVCRLVLGWLASRMNWAILGKTPENEGVMVRRPSGKYARLRIARGEKLAVRCIESGISRRLTVPVQNQDRGWEYAWDDLRWPEIVIQAMHTVRPDHVFVSAADAAARIAAVQLGRRERIRLTVAGDGAELADRAAARFIQVASEAIRDRGRFVVALAGGSTPEALYRRLTGAPYAERLTWDKVEWFWGDERWVPHDDPRSNHGMAKRALLDSLPVSSERIHPIPTHHDTAAIAAEEYETTIREIVGAPGGTMPVFDLILLGVGTDGHTASWFPDGPLDMSLPSFVWGGYVPSAEAPRVTLTPRTIGAARRIFFIVSGTAKAEIVARTLYPPWEGRHPAARVELSDGDIEWFLDAGAAAGINPSDFRQATA